MSFLLTARMGQFKLHKLARAESPEERFDPIETYGDRFTDLGHLATINWLVAGSLGIPAKPFDVLLCRAPLRLDGDGWAMEGSFTLREDANYTLRLTQALHQIRVIELFCVTTRCSAPDPQTEIFAIDAASNEIPESRQTAIAPLGTAFFGPGVVGLRSTGTVTLEALVAFGISDLPSDREFELLATVAPALSGVPDYDKQHYLGQDGTAAETLVFRLLADGLARANAPLPASGVLDHYVHRENSSARAALVLDLEPIRMVEQHFAAILVDPEWSYRSQHLTDGTFSPAAAMQLLALAGPVEATTLGASVTVPIPTPFPFLESAQAVFEAVAANGYLPVALVRIVGHHLGTDGPVVTQAYAGLTFSQAPRFTARASDARLPAGRDLPGTCDVAVYLERPSRSLAIYPDLSDGEERFPCDERMRPRAHLAGGDSTDETTSGLPRFMAGPFDLPFDSPTDQALVLHGRDIFGRWTAPSRGHCALFPLEVQAPTLYPPEIDYREHGSLSLRFRLSWNWALRTPFDLRIAVATGIAGDVEPASGVHLPGFLDSAPLSIRFDGDAPRLEGVQLPAGIEVAAIPLTPTSPPSPPSSDHRSYVVSIPMGSVKDHFDADTFQDASLAVDAWEQVGAHKPERRSSAEHQRVRLADPRAPILNGGKWALVWASRPNGGKVARAFFDLQPLSKQPVIGYHAFRTHESAILDLAVAAMPGDELSKTAFVAGVLGTRNHQIRLAMIRGAVTPYLHKPAFLRSFVELFEVDRTTLSPSEIELSVPGSQSGLEFVMFMAISKAGIASDRLDLSNLFAIAVPPRDIVTPPVLRLFIPDGDSALAAAGSVLAVASASAPFDPSQLRFFWDDAEAISSEELLHRLEPLSSIDAIEADRLVPGTGQALGGDFHSHRHYFVLQAPPRWGAQHFACSLSKSAGWSSAGDVVSPRSNLVSVHLVPAIGPQLEIAEMVVSAGTVSWKISSNGVDGTTHDRLAASRIQIDLVDHLEMVPTAAPRQFAEFLANGVTIASVTASWHGPGEIHVSHPIDISGKHVRIAISDPVGRFDVLFLSPPVA